MNEKEEEAFIALSSDSHFGDIYKLDDSDNEVVVDNHCRTDHWTNDVWHNYHNSADMYGTNALQRT
jgi:hypothetical protein